MYEYTKVSWADLHEFKMGSSRVYSGPLGCSGLAFVINMQPAGMSAPYHSHDVAEEVCVLLQGRGEIQIGDETVEMKPFDAVRLPPGVPHANRNASKNEDALWLVMGTPLEEYASADPKLYGPKAAFAPTHVE